MRRIILLILVPVLLIAAGPAPVHAVDNDSIEAVKARVQKALDAAAAKTPAKVLVLPIREDIEASTAVYVEREMERAKYEKVDVVVVDMHTPGGLGDAMLRICNAFLQRTVPSAERIPVVSFVDTDAYSAGAIISLSCGRIYMAPGGKMGAATGWFPGADGLPVKLPDDVHAKFLSGQLAEVRTVADDGGYPSGIAEAMVDRNAVLTEFEIDGRREFLTEKDFENRKVALNLSDLSPTEFAARVKVGQVISPRGEVLTLTTREAVRIGLASGSPGTREEVFEALGLKSPVVRVAEHNWSEFLFGFFTSGAVRGILLMIGLMGLYMEFKAPGLGLPGIVGVVCLGLFFFSQYFMGLAGYTGVLVFLLGVVLLLIELFVIPGFGVTGVVGILLMVVGLFLGMQPWVIPNIQNPFEMHVFLMNVLTISVVLVIMAAFAVVLAKVLPSVPFLNRLILTSTGPAGELRSSGTQEDAEKALVGVRGKALSGLHPTGRAEFGERIVDVVTEGGFLEAGTPIVVSRVEGNRVVVKKAE